MIMTVVDKTVKKTLKNANHNRVVVKKKDLNKNVVLEWFAKEFIQDLVQELIAATLIQNHALTKEKTTK